MGRSKNTSNPNDITITFKTGAMLERILFPKSEADIKFAESGKFDKVLDLISELADNFQTGLDKILTKEEKNKLLKLDYQENEKIKIKKDNHNKRHYVSKFDYPGSLFYAIDKNNYNEMNDLLLDDIFNTLTPREVEVLKYYYKDKFTLEECGKQFNVTKERVRQIREKALRKLRHKSRIQYLYPKEYIKELRNEVKVLSQDIQNYCNNHPEGIEKLNLSARLYNCLLSINIKSVEQVKLLLSTKRGIDRLIKTRNLGTKSLNELRTKLFEYCGFTSNKFDDYLLSADEKMFLEN